jgi:hypothetical protein
MLSNFNLPSVDHLVEGVHYRIIDWNFAEGCPEGEKMVFGTCRKLKDGSTDEKDFDSSKKTKQEEEGEAEAKKQGSDVKNNKPFMVGNRKMGWAIKNGKPVMVEWGSVAGEKKAAAKPAAAGAGSAAAGAGAAAAPKPKEDKPQAPAPAAPRPANVLANPNANSGDRQAAINEIGRRTMAT